MDRGIFTVASTSAAYIDDPVVAPLGEHRELGFGQVTDPETPPKLLAQRHRKDPHALS
jgi:hypothetical protein